jgi:hypothetical protein
MKKVRMMKMNNVYDNGYKILGTIKDIKEYSTKLLEHFKIVGDDYVVETCEETLEIIEELKEYADDTIVMINYDNGMGFTWEIWTKDMVVNDER